MICSNCAENKKWEGLVPMNLNEVREKIAPVLREHGVRAASVFGSAARGEKTPGDIDLMIQYGSEKIATLFDFLRLKQELEETLDLKIDLVTENALSPYMKDNILRGKKDIGYIQRLNGFLAE